MKTKTVTRPIKANQKTRQNKDIAWEFYILVVLSIAFGGLVTYFAVTIGVVN